ncbi:hypothetical protein [Paraglaciecola sp. L3A3]|uniref:hypothetical protein n=1 Tax=Paraglaciecola sp. L3A3 TaxID=2686358 RepID=UPI001E3AA0F6|nr:hypothetical protein [Paraglaciecola sp. L3A3]
MLDKKYNSTYTIAVDQLVKSVSSKSRGKLSLMQQAEEYFNNVPIDALKLAELSNQIIELKEEIDNTPLFKFKPKVKLIELETLETELAEEQAAQEKRRVSRLNDAINVCLKILYLTEGSNHQETQLKSAKFLATMLLFSPGEGKALAELHQRLKPAYKAVLSLRLLDKLISNGGLKNNYILTHFEEHNRFSSEKPNQIGYTQAVLLPVMLAAIFQDVGWHHPDVTVILDGEEGEKDRFRLLDKNEKAQVAALNHQYTIEYLEKGLGCQQGIESIGQQKALFAEAESQRLSFQSTLMTDASAIKFGISEVIKIPQIYASIVFSTKRDFSKSTLPMASLLISQLANNNKLSLQVVDAFISIVGRFPLGYGIIYIPKNTKGIELNCYEYAIVTGLNPLKIDEPSCRLVSRNLMFADYGKNEVIEKSRNTHFEIARKKLDRIDPNRLLKIRQSLTYKFDPKNADDLIPAYWEAFNYFFVEGYQNLWNHAGQED